MDSKIKEELNNIKGILNAEMAYIQALENNDADVSLNTILEFNSEIYESFDKFQKNAVEDMCHTISKQLEKENESCKCVSLY